MMVCLDIEKPSDEILVPCIDVIKDGNHFFLIG